jgi:predicted Zn-dependent protease
MDRTKANKIIIIVSGLAFLASSLLGLGGIIATSFNQPAAKENASQSQSSQLNAQEKGYIAVLQREPKNKTALEGLTKIVATRMQLGDVPGTRASLQKLIEFEPENKTYKELLTAVDKQIADAKKAGNTKSAQPQPSK